MPNDPDRARRKAADEREEMRIGFRMMGLAWQMVTEVLAGAGVGWVVDHFAGTAPLWLAHAPVLCVGGSWVVGRGAPDRAAITDSAKRSAALGHA